MEKWASLVAHMVVYLQWGKPGFNSWFGKIPWRKRWQPLQYSCLENPMNRGAWQATFYGLQRVRQDWTEKETHWTQSWACSLCIYTLTMWISFHLSCFFFLFHLKLLNSLLLWITYAFYQVMATRLFYRFNSDEQPCEVWLYTLKLISIFYIIT